MSKIVHLEIPLDDGSLPFTSDRMMEILDNCRILFPGSEIQTSPCKVISTNKRVNIKLNKSFFLINR